MTLLSSDEFEIWVVNWLLLFTSCFDSFLLTFICSLFEDIFIVACDIFLVISLGWFIFPWVFSL